MTTIAHAYKAGKASAKAKEDPDSLPMPDTDFISLLVYMRTPDRGTRKARALGALYRVFPDLDLDVEFVNHPTPYCVVALKAPRRYIGPKRLQRAMDAIDHALSRTSTNEP